MELADSIESVFAFNKSLRGFGVCKHCELVLNGGADAAAKQLGFGGSIRVFGNDAVDDAICH